MYFPHTFVPSPGTTPKADDFCIQSLTTFRMSTHQKLSTFHSFLHSYLNSIGWALDTLGHVHITLWHPPLSHWYDSGTIAVTTRLVVIVMRIDGSEIDQWKYLKWKRREKIRKRMRF
jgi:hypothetical protein